MRTGHIRKKPTKADPKFNSTRVARFINRLMQHGKKTIARDIVYKALEQSGATLEKEPLEVLEKALENVSPSMEVRSRRVGGATYQVPMPVRTERKEQLSMRWIIQAARKKDGKDMQTKLAQELIAAYQGEGDAMHQKETIHKMAEANRAFAHFKW